MRLAEALILRSDLKKRLAHANQRMVECVRVQEGDTPPEDPNTLETEFMAMTREFATLATRINATNLGIVLPDGQSMTAALAQRDILKVQIAFLRAAADGAVGKQARVTRSEVKFVPTINIADFRDRADRLAQELRELDTMIQSANWQYDLLD